MSGVSFGELMQTHFAKGEQGLCFFRTDINYLTFCLCRAITHSFTCSTSRRAASNSCLSPPANRQAFVDPICLKQRAEAAGLHAVAIKDGDRCEKEPFLCFFDHLMRWMVVGGLRWERVSRKKKTRLCWKEESV